MKVPAEQQLKQMTQAVKEMQQAAICVGVTGFQAIKNSKYNLERGGFSIKEWIESRNNG